MQDILTKIAFIRKTAKCILRKIYYLCIVMAQRLIQVQEQKLAQRQRLTQQQLLVVRMIEMPLAEFEQSVQAEIDDNPALETASEDVGGAAEAGYDGDAGDGEESDTQDGFEQEERRSALDEVLKNIGIDDEMPAGTGRGGNTAPASDDYEEHVYGGRKSFYDTLHEQVTETELTGAQSEIMEYLIGSLDSDGLLRKSADDIADEIAIYHNMDITAADVEATMEILKGFDPAGIGASSLQECLLLQIERRPPSVLRERMRVVISDCYDAFMAKHYAKIAAQTGLDETELRVVTEEIRKLNPKPGAALCETEGASLQQITPDFIVETSEDGGISFYINGGHVPELYVSPAFTDLLKSYKVNGESMNKRDKEALLYAKQRVERARGYIEAVKQRQATMYSTMKAIIDLQREYFAGGDENDLKPMVLKDVAQRAGLDISTVSRVCAVKYVQTKWGIFRLKQFFSESIRGVDGEEMSTKRLKAVLKEIIRDEDKDSPLNDDALSEEMRKRGYNIARRTVAKYREQLGIPVSRLRK